MRLLARFLLLRCFLLILIGLCSTSVSAAQNCLLGTWQSPPNSLWDAQNGSYQVRAESEHFQLRWEPASANVSQADAQQTLVAMEDIFDWFVSDAVNWPEPYCRRSVKYKAQIFINDGYGLSGAGAGFDVPAMWVGSFAISAAARGDIGGMVHEFTHSMQFNSRGLRGGQLPGWAWESHAEFMAHQYPANSNKTGCAVIGAWQPHLYYGTSRTRYCSWMFWDFAKNEMGFDAVNRMWSSTASIDDQDPILAFRTANGLSQTELQDLFGRYSMANVNWDYRDRQDGFNRGAAYRSAFRSNTTFYGGDETKYLRQARMEAIDLANRRFVVSDYFAPQRYGYNHVRLMPDSNATQITVDFHGVVQDAMVSNADIGLLKYEPETPNTRWSNYVVPRNPASNWRWGIVAINERGESRYSDMMSGAEGQLTFQLEGNEREVFLTVAATPDEHHSIFWDQKYHTIYRYPYKVQLAGAMPQGFEQGFSSRARNGFPAGRIHPNGGGWVANQAQVDTSVYVGPNAAVIGGSVRGNARIEDYAAVWRGEVRDNAVIGGLTQLNRNVVVSGNASIRAVVADGHTFETNTGTVNGNTVLFGDLLLSKVGASSLSQGVFSGFYNVDSSGGPEFGANRTALPVEVTARVDDSFPGASPTPDPTPVPDPSPVPDPTPPTTNPDPSLQLAPTAVLATSYVSLWENLSAVNNGTTHSSSADKNGGAYGNWRGVLNYRQTDWVSFSWDNARRLRAFEVYWWDDGMGIEIPTTAVVEYWNGSTWSRLGNIGVASDRYNRLEFTPVSTTSIRVAMSSRRATGILEARVWESLAAPEPAPQSTPVNLAPAAGLSTSHVSPWENLSSVNNGSTHANSADKNGGAYGNWKGSAGFGQTESVTLDWDNDQVLSSVEVYWWNDGMGIVVPNIAEVEYREGNAWVSLGNIGVALNRYNRIDFDSVSTNAIRISMSSNASTGILEARVWGIAD